MSSTTEYHVQLHKSELNTSGNKELRKVYPITTSADVITKGVLARTDIESATLKDIILALGDMAFQDIYADATSTSKGIVQLSHSYENDSEETAPSSKALNDLYHLLQRTSNVIENGEIDGTIKVNNEPIFVGGLKSAAYHQASEFATAEQGIKADGALQRTGGTMTGPIRIDRIPTSDAELVNKLYVEKLVNDLRAETSNAVINMGTVSSEADLPYEYTKNGWQYKVAVTGNYCGYECKVGDNLICNVTGENTEKNSTNWGRVPSADENETYIRFSKTFSNLTETFKTGEIVLGEAATRQVKDNIESIDTSGDLATIYAIVRYIKEQGFARKSELTKVKGAKEETWRGGEIEGEVRPFVNLTPANIGAATEEQGEKADSAIQEIRIGSVETSDEGTNAVVTAETDPTSRVTRLSFIIPKGDTGVMGPTGPVGTMGPTGPQGYIGPIGPTGPAGEDGTPGSIGPTGPFGATGPTGPRGVIGAMGPTGAQGTQGDPGPVGPTGPMGPTGPRAIRGNAIYYDTNMRGAFETETVFNTTDITDAMVNDFNINPDTFECYRCTLGGDPTVARWKYFGCLKFEPLVVSDTEPTGTDNFWYEMYGGPGYPGPSGSDVQPEIPHNYGYTISEDQPTEPGLWYQILSEETDG